MIFFPVPTLDFYFERNDAYLHWTSIHLLKPIVGHTYNYELYYEFTAYYCWHFKVREGSTVVWQGSSVTNPQTYIDISAYVETSVTSIDIDGSHFSSLKYYTGSNWYLWSGHSQSSNYPYYVVPISHYEFYAYGGG